MAIGVFLKVDIKAFVMLPQVENYLVDIGIEAHDVQLLVFQTGKDDCKSPLYLLPISLATLNPCFRLHVR